MPAVKKITAVVLFIWSFLPISAQDTYSYHKGKIKHRISAGPVLSFYKNHPQHTVNTQAETGFCASYKMEIAIERKTGLLVGLEYLSHGLTFQGYYSAPGNTYLFDRTFAYTHEIRVQEIQLPIAYKKAFNLEKDNFYTPYFFLGVGARYIIGSYYVITNDSTGDVVYDGKGSMDFEHQAATQIVNKLFKGVHQTITREYNAFFQGGLGTQYNFRNSAKSIFFEITYKYGISRLHYEGYQNSNDLNIKDSHWGFTVGVKF